MTGFYELRDKVQQSKKTRSDYIKGIVAAVPDMTDEDVSVSSIGEYKQINRSGLEKLFKHVLNGRGERS